MTPKEIFDCIINKTAILINGKAKIPSGISRGLCNGGTTFWIKIQESQKFSNIEDCKRAETLWDTFPLHRFSSVAPSQLISNIKTWVADNEGLLKKAYIQPPSEEPADETELGNCGRDMCDDQGDNRLLL